MRFETSLSHPRPIPFFLAGSYFRARHPTFRTRAAGQDRATYAPGTTWPANRATARLIPGQAPTPGS